MENIGWQAKNDIHFNSIQLEHRFILVTDRADNR